MSYVVGKTDNRKVNDICKFSGDKIEETPRQKA